MNCKKHLHGTVATDASWCPYTKASDYAILIHRDDGRPIMKSGLLRHHFENSQSAEEWAILLGIAEAKKQGFKAVTVRSDCLSAIKKLKKRNDKMSIKVVFKHVKAHGKGVDIYSCMNRWCDKTARKILRASRNKRAADEVKRPNKDTMRSKQQLVWNPRSKSLSNWVT